MVKEGPDFIKEFKSEEINKIINIIYDSKPENIQLNDSEKQKHLEIINYVDSLEKPKVSFWKKKR